MKGLKNIFMLAILFFAGQTLAQVNNTIITHQKGMDYRVSYRLINNGKEVEITSGVEDVSAISPKDFTEFSIPKTIYGKFVTKIGDGAFYGCSALTSIIIPDKVTTIGKYAFYGCSKLTNVKLGTNLKEIGNYAFKWCFALTSIIIPDKVTIIGGGAFTGCSALTSIIIPDNVTKIGESAFYGCSALTSIIIPDNVTKIGNETFRNCSKLANVKLETNLEEIGDYAFDDCSALTSIIIPDNVTIIGGRAFNGCSKLARVTLGTNLKEIGYFAFRGCSALTSIIIPDNVTKIGFSAFHSCSKLANVKLGKNLKEINFDAFRSCSTLTSIIIPDEVTTIGDGAFYGCSALTSIIIPEKVTIIGGGAFNGCSKLANVTLGKNLTRISDYAFYGCSALTSIIIPENVTIIGISTFYNCSKLAEVKLGKNLKEIGYGAFRGCSALTEVFFAGKKPTTVGSDIYSDGNDDLKNYITEINAEFWDKDVDDLFLPFGGKPVEIFGQKTLTFLSNDTAEAKKSTQKFMPHRHFNLLINKLTEKGKIFAGWEEKNSDKVYADRQEVAFTDDITLVAKWQEIEDDDGIKLFNLDKNYAGLIDNGLGFIYFKIDKNAKVSGKIITQNKSYSFSTFINYQIVDDGGTTATTPRPAFTLKNKDCNMILAFDATESSWKISVDREIKGKIEGNEIRFLNANEVLTDFTGLENVTDKKYFTFSGNIDFESEDLLEGNFLQTPFILAQIFVEL